jgi:hypothetical protein
MRIEVPPSNIAPLPDRKIPNAEEGQEDQSGSTFLDVIAQMTAAAGQSEETSPENAPSPGRGKQEEGSCENSTVAALPAAPVNSEMQTFFADPDAPAAPEVLSFSKFQNQHAPDHPAGVRAADSTANRTGEATSDCTPFAASNLTSGVSGTVAIPVIFWPAMIAPFPAMDIDAAAPRDPAAFSTAEIREAGVPSDSARGFAMPAPEGNLLNEYPPGVPGQALILGPKVPGLASLVPRGHALQLNLFDLPTTSTPEQAGTPPQVEFTATPAAPAQSMLPGDAVPGLRADGAAASSAQSSLPSLNAAIAAPSDDGPALSASAAPEVFPLSRPPAGVAAGSRVGTPQPEALEGFHSAEPQAAAVEGIRTGRPPVIAPEIFRVANPQPAVRDGLRMGIPQTVPLEESQIGMAQAVFIEGCRADSPQAAGTEAFRISIPPAAAPEQLSSSGQQIAVPENPGSEYPQDATQGRGRMGEPDIATPERFRMGNPLEIAPEQARGSSLAASVPEESRMSSSQVAGQSREGLTDAVLKEAALPLLRESDISVEVIHSSAPAARELEAAQPHIQPANPMIAVNGNADGNQRQIHAMQLQVPSDPVAQAAVEPVQVTTGEPAENVHPGTDGQRPSDTRLVLDLSAYAADVIPDLTAAQIPPQGGRRPEVPAQSDRLAAVLPFSEAPGNASGRAELPTNVSKLDLATPGPSLTGKRSEDEAEGRAGAKPQPLKRRGQEPAQASDPVREPGRPDSTRRMAPIVVPGADLRGDSSREGNLLDSLNRMLTEAQRAAVETSRDKTAVRPPLPADDAEPAPAEAPEVLPGFAPDALVRANASMAAIHAALRPVQHGASISSIPGATGAPLPVHTAAAEIKALAALLTPKSSAPSQEPDFLAQLAARMQMQLRDGESMMRIQLKPSTLGHLEIKAETTMGGVAATILTESPNVKNYLEHNLHILQQSLQDQGLKIDRIQVVVQEGFWLHHPSSGNQESRSGSGQREEADPSVRRRERVEQTVEELALDAHTLALMSPHRTFHTVA